MDFGYFWRVKKPLFVIFILCFVITASGQQSTDNSQVQTALKVRQLVEKKSEYHRKTNGEYEGYRIKIHFGVDRAAAKNVQGRFNSKFSGMQAYEDYQQPNFVVTVGDFKTKLEAFEALKKIQADFPNAFIVKSKIRPMKVS